MPSTRWVIAPKSLTVERTASSTACEALRQIDRYLTGTRTITVASSHPQGGNAIGGVVDHDLRVRGYDNLYVADASVFPGSVQVNPQLSVMAVARYAALRILNDRRS
jgi:choline dehydrogenase-like flavoprotein